MRADDVRFGNDPLAPPPDQSTCHAMVAVTSKTPPGSPADVRRKVCPQSGDGASPSDFPSFRYGVPGPEQVTVDPSPIDHFTDFGVAVAVTVTPPALTVDAFETHEPGRR